MTSTATISANECATHLAKIAGDPHVRIAGDSVSCAPADAAQISEILRFANANSVSVTARGSGTKTGWGNPVDAGIHLEMKRLTTLREHPWQDMTCTVEAGCTWAAMQTELAKFGQMVALDPLWPERATVGGIVATNDGGALRLKYGSLRDLIIGMTVVLADGTVAKTGGKVVKNVAGYDLHKLMTGSFGTLGIITEVNFRLHPAETSVRTWTATAPNASAFAEPLRKLLDSQITPSCVQLRLTNSQCAVDVRIATRPESLDDQAAKLRMIFAPLDLAESSQTLWQSNQQLFEDPGAVVLKASMLSSQVCTVSAEVEQWASDQGIELSLAAQASGIMTVALKGNNRTAPALVEQLRSKLKKSGGSVTALQIPDAMRAGLDVWGCDSNALPLMREIKRRFDPNRTLNPGRFVGNI
jgi:glycolate oxidase FAD binding subunit